MTRATRRCADHGRDRGTTRGRAGSTRCPAVGSDDSCDNGSRRQNAGYVKACGAGRVRRCMTSPSTIGGHGDRRAKAGRRAWHRGTAAEWADRYQAAARIRNERAVGHRGALRDGVGHGVRRRQSVLVEAVAQPRAGVPRAPFSLQFRKARLCGERATVQQRMRILELAQHACRVRFEGRIQRDDDRRRARQRLQLVDEIGDGDRARAGGIVGRQVVPGGPGAPRPRKQRRVRVQDDAVALVAHARQQSPFTS